MGLCGLNGAFVSVRVVAAATRHVDVHAILSIQPFLPAGFKYECCLPTRFGLDCSQVSQLSRSDGGQGLVGYRL